MGAVSLLEDLKERLDDSLHTLLAAMDEPSVDYNMLHEQDEALKKLWRPDVDRLHREWRRLDAVKQQLVTSLTEAISSMNAFLDYATDPSIDLAMEVVTQKKRIAELEQQLASERHNRVEAQKSVTTLTEQLATTKESLQEETHLRQKAETERAKLKQDKEDRGMFVHDVFRKPFGDLSSAKPGEYHSQGTRGKKGRK